MRLFKLKTSLLALIFSVITIAVHIGGFYLMAATHRSGMLVGILQNSYKIYWPAFDLIQILGPMGNGGALMSIVVMFLAAWLEWWVIYAAGIWIVRLYFREQPISKRARIAIVFGVLAVGVCFYREWPERLGMSKYQSFRFDVETGKIDKVKEGLRQNPGFANQAQPGWGTALHEAARSGRADVVELLLEHGSDINATELEGDTPLHTAVKWGGHEDVVKVLIAHKANVNAGDKDGMTPLCDAAGEGYTNIIMLLLTNGANVNARDKYGNCPLSSAIMNNRYGIVPLLLSNGADPTIADLSGDTMLDRAALQDSPALAEMLLPYFQVTNYFKYVSKGFSCAFAFGHMDVAVPIEVGALRFETNSIHDAAFKGNVDDVRARLKAQPDLLNTDDFLALSPLHRAVQGGQAAMVQLLLAQGADTASYDENGNTPLHWAVFLGENNIVKILIDGRANVNAKGAQGKSPLHLAVQQGFLSIAEILLEAGADSNASASGGQTPLCIAVEKGNVEAARLLLASHASFGVRIYGGTLFHAWAMGTANVEIANLLLTNSCEVNATNTEGKTPLHVLVETTRFGPAQVGQVQAIQWLLDHKADVNAKDDKGETPLSLLKYHGGGRVIERRKDIGDLLRKYGAKD
jgi:ankyrin repeat protein